MIYRADQIALWPRLLSVAKLDPVLTAAFIRLVQGGADLQIHEDGSAWLSPGQMPKADYDAIKAEMLAPRGPKVIGYLGQVSKAPHPWMAAIQAAYLDLDGRCTKGETYLAHVIQRKLPIADIATVMQSVVARHRQAMSIARAMLDAGYGAFETHCSKHMASWQDLWKPLGAALGQPYEHTGVAWPVQTPDGWFWVVDVQDLTPQPVDLGDPVGVRTPVRDEPVITDWDLGRALSSIETMRKREVG